MAAYITGVHKFIKDAATPWDQKLKLARFAWQSEKCFIPNKHQVLLNWACTSITQASKFEISIEHVQQLWLYLSDILGSVHLQELIQTGTLVTLRANFNGVVIKILEGSSHDEEQLSVVLKCCRCILTYPTLAINLISNFEKLSQLAVAVMKISIAGIDETGELSNDLKYVLEAILKHYQSALGKQTSARKLLISTQEHFLIPSFRLLGATSPDLIIIQQQLQVILSISVFNRELHAGYVDYLRSFAHKHVKPTELKLIIFQIQHFFEFLRDSVESCQGPVVECICAAFPKLFEWFLASVKPSSDVAFAFLCKICSILNLCDDPIQSVPTADTMETEKTETSEQGKTTNWTLALPCVEQMLGAVFKHNIYQVASDAANGKPMFIWLNQLLLQLLNEDLEFSSSWYRCFHHMLELNHLLVEPHLKEILTKGLLNASSSAEDLAKVNFFDRVLQVYTKLRQFDRFVSVLLESIHESELSGFEWQDCLPNFPEYIHILTPGISLDVWKLFHNEISTHYISKLVVTDEPPAKKKKSLTHSLNVKNLQAVASLFKIYLLELPLVSMCSTAPNMKKLKNIMNEMKVDLLASLMSQPVSQDASLTYSTYMLCYAWGECDLLLRQYTPYALDQKLNLPDSFKQGDFSYLHNYVTPTVWMASTSTWLEAEDRGIDSIMILLDFQQVCSLLLFEDSEDPKLKSVIQQKIDFILAYSSTVILSPTQIEHVDKLTSELFAVNYLETLTSRFPIMLPFLSNAQLMVIARLFIHTMDSSKPAEIVEQFLRSTVCLESRKFQSVLMRVLLEEMLSSIKNLFKLSPKNVAKMTEVFAIADDDMWDQVAENMLREKENDHELWQQVKKVTMVIASYEHYVGDGFNWKQKEINALTHTLQTLRSLPFEHLLPSNHVRCLLVLCMLNYTLSQTSMAEGVPECLMAVHSFLKILCQVDVRGSFFDLAIGCRLLGSLTTSLMRQTVLPTCHKDELQLRSVSHDIISSLLSAAYKSDKEDALSEMSRLLLGELKGICKTLDEGQIISLDMRHSITSLLALVSVFLKQATLFARRKNKDQKELLMELCDLAGKSSQLIQHLQREDVVVDWHQETQPVLEKVTKSQESSELLEEEEVSNSLLLCNILQLSSVLLRYYAEVIKISDEGEFERKWSSDFLPLLQKVLNVKMQTSSDIVKRILELFRSVCLVADVSDVVSGDDLERMWLRVWQYFKCDSDYNEEAKLCGQTVLKYIDSSRFAGILSNIQTSLTSQNADEMSCSLMILQIIAPANLQHDNWQVWRQSSPQVLLSLVDYLHSLRPVSSKDVYHVCGAVNAIISMLIQGNDLLPAKVAMTTLHVVHVVPLIDFPAENFSKCFKMLFRLLDTLLLQYPKQVISSLPSFLQCVKYLLSSVMFRGREAIGSSCNKVPEKLMLECAEDMDRLLTLLASHKDDVQKVIVVLISEYINELQIGTLHPAVKKSLVNGLNSIVAVCDDKSLALLGATLPDGLKEIYKGFYSDYKKYFKYTGRV